MSRVDFADLDARIEALALARRRAQCGLDEEEPVVPRALSTLELLGELEATKGYALSDALVRWVAHLILARVTAEERAKAGKEIERTVPSELSQVEGLTIAAVVRRMLEAPDPRSDARLLRDTLRVHGRDDARRYADRYREAARRLDRPALFLDAGPLAEAVLAATDAARPEPRDGDAWFDVLRTALARDAGEGWPAQITPRYVRDVLSDAPYAGLRLEVAALPRPLGAASFARAFAAFGEAFASADRPVGSFCLSRAPDDLLVARRAGLYGAIVLEPSFHRRQGLGAARAKDQVRTVARAAVLWLRIAALRVLAWPLLGHASGPRELADLSERALGRPLDGELLAVVPRLAPGRDAELWGMVESAADRDALRERFDEDWFENPRAIEALREEHHRTLADRPAPRTQDELVAALGRRLGEALDG